MAPIPAHSTETLPSHPHVVHTEGSAEDAAHPWASPFATTR